MDSFSLKSINISVRQEKPRVLVLAYSISPVRGSEYSVGWNYVRHMAERCELTVLYGLAGPHMGDFEEIESIVTEFDDISNVTFEPIYPNVLARTLNAPNRKGVLTYSFYLAYRVWHWQAARRAQQIITEKQIDLIHYLCPNGYREPGYLWKIDKPYIWGPVGGLVSTRILKGAPRTYQSRLRTRIKNLINSVQLKSSRRVASAFRKANVVIAATSENHGVIQSRFDVEPLQFPENAIPDEWLKKNRTAAAERSADETVRMIWIGSMDDRKSPDLLIDALSRITARNWHLDVVGNGPMNLTTQLMAHERNLDKCVTFHGVIPREDVWTLLSSSDLHLITSMSEGNPTTIWEAMAAGVPTVSLDHNGMHDVLCENCGFLVPIGNYNETCEAFADAISQLLRNTQHRESLKQGTRTCRDQFRWSLRTEEWLSVYQTAIKRHKKG